MSEAEAVKLLVSCRSSVPLPQQLHFRVPLDPAEFQYQDQAVCASLLQGPVHYSSFKLNSSFTIN